jgi:hypothetical protein
VAAEGRSAPLPVRVPAPAENRLRACAGITERLHRPSPKGPKHNDAAFLAYGPAAEHGGIPMRLILGIILGAALTVGGAYISDTAAGAGAKPMVNWDVVAKNFDEVSAVTRAGWKKITG